MKNDVPLLVLTIGHSTHPLAEFIALLKAHEVDCLVDVRTIPRSRTNPQFNRETLPAALAEAGIEHVAMPGLGGLRRAQATSSNTGWRNKSFRAFADYMQTEEFAKEIDNLVKLAATRRAAIMCAEAVPWRCHRSLIADALMVRGVRVEDIMSLTRRTLHRLTPWAVVEGERITYPASSVGGAETLFASAPG